MTEPLSRLCINTIRMLAADAIDKANSGHPGLPLGAAPMAYVLWTQFLRHNPQNPQWFNRDRFILSAGHGSAMLYALLHLTGYDLALEQIKNFRQWESKTPGHPEFGLTPGVEATTGPLGQGFAMGVGMAIAERFLAAYFNRADYPLVDHYTYAIVSDGDLMEGVTSEAASLAGHLRLGRLIYLYDSNKISIEGSTDLTFTEDVGRRFEAYRWHVLSVPDGNDIDAISEAILKAQGVADRPSLIIVETHIGYGSPRQDQAEVHGSPLGAEALRKTKENFGWPQSPPFYIPPAALSHFRTAVEKGERLESNWRSLLKSYHRDYPELAAGFELALQGKLPENLAQQALPVFPPSSKGMATRVAAGKVLNVLAQKLPTLIGGSADLAPSTKTLLTGCGDFSWQNPLGRNLHFGIREHVMGAIVNGMAIHRGIIPYGATFLVFSDYMRPALRLAAIMQTKAVFIFTHDSIGLGEDGPTHQPVEHLMSLRAIPGLKIIRPADANEAQAAWLVAVSSEGPIVLALTRQEVPELDPKKYPIERGVPRGAYVLAEAPAEKPQIILLATGSEVHLALAGQAELGKRGVLVRVVSMPCREIFAQQPQQYRSEVLLPGIPRLAIEAGVTLGWREYAEETIGLDRFGASAPWEIMYENLGFSAARVAERALSLLNGRTKHHGSGDILPGSR